MQYYIMYTKDSETVGTVVATSNDPKSEEAYPQGFWVDDLPVPSSSAARRPVLKVNLTDMSLYYVYVDSSGNSTNDLLVRLNRVESEMNLLKDVVDGLVLGGM